MNLLSFSFDFGVAPSIWTRLAVALALAGCLVATDSSAIELSTSYQDSPPKYFVLDDGQIGGLCVEISQLIEQALPPEAGIRFASRGEGFVPILRILKWLERGEIDVFVGLARNEDREARFVFLDTPLYEVNHVVAARGDDDVSVSSFEDLRRLSQDRPILSLSGSSTASYLRKQAGIEVDDGARTIEQNLDKLLAGRARFVYFHDLGLRFAIEKSFSDTGLRILPTSFHSYRHYLAFSRHASPEVVQEVEKALERVMKSGALGELRKRY